MLNPAIGLVPAVAPLQATVTPVFEESSDWVSEVGAFGGLVTGVVEPPGGRAVSMLPAPSSGTESTARTAKYDGEFRSWVTVVDVPVTVLSLAPSLNTS